MKVGDKIIYKGESFWDLTKGNIYVVIETTESDVVVIDDKKEPNRVDNLHYSAIEVGAKKETKTPEHYDNSKGSLYQFAEQHKLNSYEFDIIKRVIRCRKKGEFLSDLNKTKNVIDIYIKEQTK